MPQLPWYTFLFGAMFAMHSHLFGEIMDLLPDRAAGRRTTGLVLGPIRSKLLLSAIMFLEAVLVFANAGDALIAGALAAGSIWFLVDAFWLWRDRPYLSWQEKLFFLGWNAAAILTAPNIWKTASLTR